MSKATPKAGLTLLSKSDDDKLQFLHSPSGAADFSLKHKLNKKFTMGVGFSDNTVRKIRSIPGLVLSGDVKATDDIDLGISHNIATGASKASMTYTTKVQGKKTAIKGNYLTKPGVFTAEVASQLADNKKVTVAFDQRSVTNVKLALTDDKFTYEPSYNLIKKAPSLAVSRSLGPGKYKFGWNLKTDDLALEYIWKEIKLAAVKRPGVDIPTVGVSFERGFEL